MPGSVTFKVLENSASNRNWQIEDAIEEVKFQFRLKYNLT
jgi:hypothetical protein